MINKFKRKVLNNIALTFDEAVELSMLQPKEDLYKAANEIRKHFCGDGFDLCSITNAKSGRCPQDCKWCCQSKHYDTDIEDYNLIDKDEVIKQVVSNYFKGVKRHSLVTSGKKASIKTLDKLITIYKSIQKKCDINLCASLGILGKNQLLRLKNEVGIEYYHCNLETAPSYFSNVCTTHTIEEKIKTIKYAQEIGLKVCSGGIIGMGETMEHRIELAIMLRDLNIQSIPINILMPIKNTPLENAKPLSEEEILTTIALFRFLNPKANLRFAGGRLQLKPYQEKALKAGINAALTGDYLTTIGSDIENDIKDFSKVGFNVV